MTAIARRRTRVVGWLVAIVVIGLAGALAAGAWTTLSAAGCGIPEDPACLRVLFIGNSYTSANDLPGTFARLARSGGLRVETSMIAPGGSALADHSADPAVLTAIAGRRWTAVVLQEQSELPVVPGAYASKILPPADTLIHDARVVGSPAFLFETWAYRDGAPSEYLDRAGMQAAIDSTYQKLASQLGATVVPVGEAWARALREAPTIELWQVDGSHPSTAGTYLAACVFYASLSGRSPTGLADTGGLDAVEAAVLQRIAVEP